MSPRNSPDSARRNPGSPPSLSESPVQRERLPAPSRARSPGGAATVAPSSAALGREVPWDSRLSKSRPRRLRAQQRLRSSLSPSSSASRHDNDHPSFG